MCAVGTNPPTVWEAISVQWFLRWMWNRDSVSARNVCLLMSNYMTAQDLKDISNHFRHLWKTHDIEDEPAT